MQRWLASSWHGSALRVARALWIGIIALLLAVSPETQASESTPTTRLVLLSATPRDPLVQRIAAELGSQGFDVMLHEVADGTEEPTDATLRRASATAGAAAAIRVEFSADAVDVWIMDFVRERTVTGRIARIPRAEGTDAVLALRTVEFLRTNLVDLLPPKVVEPDVPPREAPLSEPEPVENEPVVHLGIAPALGSSPGGSGFSLGGLVWTRFHLGTSFGVEVLGAAPVVSAVFEGSEGSATLRVLALGSGFLLRPVRSRSVTPDFALGAALLVIHVQGVPVQGYEGRSSTDLAASPYLRSGLRLPLTAALGVRADLLGGVSIPRTVVVFADRRGGAWGSPWLLVSLGLDIGWR
jgi:hypothetical protein